MQKINNSYLILLASVAALGGMLFGFDIAIITGAGPFIETHFELSKIGLGVAFSALIFGCLVGAAVAGKITDSIGRKKTLFYVAILFFITTLATGLAINFTSFLMARFLGGVAVGAASIASPMYIAEISPSKIRGRMVSFYQLSIVFGILVSYLINYLLRNVDDNWRWMFITGTIPSSILFGLLFIVPESPRYLIKIGKSDLAKKILNNIGGNTQVEEEVMQIQNTMVRKKISLSDFLQPGAKAALTVGIVLAVLVQVTGINAIVDYSPVIFRTAGWDIDAALFGTFGVGFVNFLFTFISIAIIDKVGRKPLYIIGSIGMAIPLLALSLLGFYNAFNGMLVFVLSLIFIASFAACIGPVFWTLMSEIFPNRIRGRAMAIPVITQWFFNGIVVFLFPWMLHNMLTATFFFLFIMCIIQLVFVWKFVPETMGKSLEDIEKMWVPKNIKNTLNSPKV